MLAPGHPHLLFLLPAEKGDVLGLACRGNGLYVSTAGAVYALQGSMLLPLVIGIGGPLVAQDGALWVLDRATGHLYRIAREGEDV